MVDASQYGARVVDTDDDGLWIRNGREFVKVDAMTGCVLWKATCAGFSI